jgi:hypothetical protein
MLRSAQHDTGLRVSENDFPNVGFRGRGAFIYGEMLRKASGMQKAHFAPLSMTAENVCPIWVKRR